MGAIRIEHLAADLLGLSDLARTALAGQLVTNGVARRADQIEPPVDRFLPGERAHLARWLESQTTVHQPPVAVLESVRALAEPGTTCVVASARPGLLFGPAANLWRCAQAVKLAQELQATWGQRVVPVLWNHADEGCSVELMRACVLNRHFDLQEVGIDLPSTRDVPLHTLPLDVDAHGLGALRAALSQLYGDLPHCERALDLFVPRAGESLPTAFTRCAYELFGRVGLVVVEPQVLGEEIAHALAQLVGSGAQSRALEAFDALPAQLVAERQGLRDEPLVVRLDTAGRRPLRSGGDGFRYTDEPGSRTATELAAELVQEPNAWAAGEAARAAVRDLLLPVAAEVAEEEDLLRHLRWRPVAEELELPSAAVVPRTRVTWFDEDARLALGRLELTAAEALLGVPKEVDAEEAARAGELVGELRAIADHARSELAARRASLVELDPTLASPLKTASRELEDVLGRLISKVGRVEATVEGRRERHRRRIRSGLRPRGGPQDELLAPFEWIARHGAEWIAPWITELDPFAGEHLALHVGEAPSD